MNTQDKSNIKMMTDELHKAYELINQKFYEGRLPMVAITIQSNGNRTLSMGWCTTKKVWGDKKGNHTMYEINLSAEYIDVSFHETMDTLMHEMVHLYNLVNGIQDVSRNGTYHNKRFKDRALRAGFIYPEDKPDKKYGFSHVKLSPATIAILDELPIKQEVFSIGRKPDNYFQMLEEGKDPEQEKKEKKKSGYRWVCPGCTMILRSSKPSLNIICGDCRLKLIQEDTE